MNEFSPKMNTADVNRISMLGLAHIGDAVYELLARTALCGYGHLSVNDLHKHTIAIVNASAQADAAKKLLPKLTEEEMSIYRRGRNAKVNSVPHNADIGHYHSATGLEALFGWLYLLGRQERITELFAQIMDKSGDE